MIELIQITNDPAFARRCDALEGLRLFVDLEAMGKAERQAGRDTFISPHTLSDVGRIKSVLRRAPLMVRLNPLHTGTASEVEAVLEQGADRLMLPMFSVPAQLREFCALVAGRVPVTALLETAGALDTLPQWLPTAGLSEVFVGLNDLHRSLGMRFMFEPLAQGQVERVATACRERGMPFGFGGIAQLEGGLLPGRDVLAEHVRLGSRSVILSRTFQGGGGDFEQQVLALRAAERELAGRSAADAAQDARRIAAAIAGIAETMASRA
jgi:hypothetical protein